MSICPIKKQVKVVNIRIKECIAIKERIAMKFEFEI